MVIVKPFPGLPFSRWAETKVCGIPNHLGTWSCLLEENRSCRLGHQTGTSVWVTRNSTIPESNLVTQKGWENRHQTQNKQRFSECSQFRNVKLARRPQTQRERQRHSALLFSFNQTVPNLPYPIILCIVWCQKHLLYKPRSVFLLPQTINL